MGFWWFLGVFFDGVFLGGGGSLGSLALSFIGIFCSPLGYFGILWNSLGFFGCLFEILLEEKCLSMLFFYNLY